MTARQVYDYLLIELNKVEAPTLLLEDYIYFLNKSIISYANKKYNFYDINQQLSDDLRVLKGNVEISSLQAKTGNKLQGATYTGVLPSDYFHILNCIVEYTVNNSRCLTTEPLYRGAKRLPSELYSGIIDNYYLKPSANNPYFYLHNSTEPVIDANGIRVNGDRDGHTSPVQIEIRYGKDNTKYVLNKIHVEYLKVPKYITLTQDQLDATLDTTQVMEFPDYVCYEIIKELVALLMENSSDPRLQTNIPVNQSIASPNGGAQKR